jgi:hypothetical protein
VNSPYYKFMVVDEYNILILLGNEPRISGFVDKYLIHGDIGTLKILNI